MNPPGAPGHVHVFGYGSLTWRPGFPAPAPRVARLHGWVRRLWQGSPDHRGTEAYLGRVATLVPAADGWCDGLVFELDGALAPSVLPQIDERERAGYVRQSVVVEFRGGGTASCVTWVAREGNPAFLGDAPLAEMVERIRAATGPSGTNREYVERLHATLVGHGITDPHVAEVVRALAG